MKVTVKQPDAPVQFGSGPPGEWREGVYVNPAAFPDQFVTVKNEVALLWGKAPFPVPFTYTAHTWTMLPAGTKFEAKVEVQF